MTAQFTILSVATWTLIAAIPFNARSAGAAKAPPRAKLVEAFCMRPGDRLLQVNGVDVSKRPLTGVWELVRKHRCDAKVDVVVKRLDAVAAYTCKPPPCAVNAELARAEGDAAPTLFGPNDAVRVAASSE